MIALTSFLLPERCLKESFKIPVGNCNPKRCMHPYVHNSTVHSSQDMEATSMSFDRGMGKEDVVHIYDGILLSHKKEWNNAICSNMDGPRDPTVFDFTQKLWALLDMWPCKSLWAVPTSCCHESPSLTLTVIPWNLQPCYSKDQPLRSSFQNLQEIIGIAKLWDRGNILHRHSCIVYKRNANDLF